MHTPPLTKPDENRDLLVMFNSVYYLIVGRAAISPVDGCTKVGTE